MKLFVIYFLQHSCEELFSRDDSADFALNVGTLNTDLDCFLITGLALTEALGNENSEPLKRIFWRSWLLWLRRTAKGRKKYPLRADTKLVKKSWVLNHITRILRSTDISVCYNLIFKMGVYLLALVCSSYTMCFIFIYDLRQLGWFLTA